MTESEITLPPDLVERVLKLTPEQQDKLIDLLYDAIEGPAEDVSAVIAERAERVASGIYTYLTREESDRLIKEEARKHGLEL
jgi:hypothetical protein